LHFFVESGTITGRNEFAGGGAMAFTGVKVFSATKAREREELGENVTRWLRATPGVQVQDKIVTQSSDREFHCLTITLFYSLQRDVAAAG
jgi:hypothetical protein